MNEPPHHLEIRYTTQALLGHLEAYERIGLDFQKTRTNFEWRLLKLIGQTQAALKTASHSVSFGYDAERTDYLFRCEPDELGFARIMRHLIGVLLSRPAGVTWLHYLSPQEHAEALIDNPSLAPGLLENLQRTYNLEPEQAKMIIAEAIDSSLSSRHNLWGQTGS